MDMPSILRLLDFLEALFNGGSDFNEPLKRCLNRLTDAKWANSDILLVSGACFVHSRGCINTVRRPAESPYQAIAIYPSVYLSLRRHEQCLPDFVAGPKSVCL